MNLFVALRNFHVLTVCLWFSGPLAFAAEDFTIVQMCDTQLGMGGYAHDVDSFEKAVVQINKMAPDLVVICGDLVDRADDKSFADFKRIRAGFRVPCHVASGNHDVGNVPTAASLARYRAEIGDDYFTVEYKGYSFLIVNTQLWKVDVLGESGKHQAWFEKTLGENAARGLKSVIVGHYPLFLKSADEAEEYFNIPMKLRGELLGLMVKYGVAAFLAGHVHRNLELSYQGIPMVASATSSRNFDNAPMGYRVWKFGEDGPVSHAFVRITGLDKSLSE